MAQKNTYLQKRLIFLLKLRKKLEEKRNTLVKIKK